MPGKSSYNNNTSVYPHGNRDTDKSVAGSLIAAVSPSMIDVYEAVRCSVSIKVTFKSRMTVAVLSKDTVDGYHIGIFSDEGIMYEYCVIENWDSDWTATLRRELLIRRSGEESHGDASLS